MELHPEIRAYLEVERAMRRARLAADAAALALALGPALILRAAAHLLFNPAVEAHFAAALEIVAFATPLLGAVALARAWLRRWAARGAVRWAAGVALRHGVDPASVSEAVHAG